MGGFGSFEVLFWVVLGRFGWFWVVLGWFWMVLLFSATHSVVDKARITEISLSIMYDAEQSSLF